MGDIDATKYRVNMANTMLLLNRRNEPMTPASLYKKCLEEAKQAGRSDGLTKGIKLSLFLKEAPMMILPPSHFLFFALSVFSDYRWVAQQSGGKQPFEAKRRTESRDHTQSEQLL